MTLYSRDGAAWTAVNYALPFVVVGLLIIYVMKESRPRVAQASVRFGLLLLAAGPLIGGTVYFALPKTEVRLAYNPRGLSHSTSILAAALVQTEQSERAGKSKTATKPDLAWVRQLLAVGSSFRNSRLELQAPNPSTGRPWREEDSPGNFTLRETGSNLELIWYDANGRSVAPHRVKIVEPAPF